MKQLLAFTDFLYESFSNYMRLQRGQKGKVEDGWDFRVVNGQHGEGVYAFLYNDTKMKEYYTKNGETVHTFKVDKKYVKDLSGKKWEYWEARKFMYKNPRYKVLIFDHSGPGIPSSKEVLITDPSIIIMDK